MLLVATNRIGVCALDKVKRPCLSSLYVITVVYNDESKCDAGKDVAAVIDLVHGKNDALEALQGAQLTNLGTT